MPRTFPDLLKLAVGISLVAAWTPSVLPASEAASQEKAAPEWPGPDAITATFTAADPPVPYKGEGGSKSPVGGVDFWSVGRPSQLNKSLGIVRADVAPLKPGQTPQLTHEEFFSLVQVRVAKVASSVGASAAIMMSASKDKDGTFHLFYRVVLYLPDDAAVDGPVRNDATPVDADGNKIPNGLQKPITTLEVADFGNRDRPLLEGSALINVCVGVDGKVTDSSIVTSSGHKELDDLGLSATKKSKYAPATVRGRPVASCTELKLTWKHK